MLLRGCLYRNHTRQKVRKYEDISLVEKAEKESAEEIHTTFGEVFIAQRIKRVVQPADR